MKKNIKKILKFALYWSGINWIAGMLLHRKVFCIGYHSVWSVKNNTELLHHLYWNISVNSDEFEKQLLFLKNNGHTFIHFRDLKKPETRKLKKPTVIFFDDGFRDVHVNALPILEKHGIPATIFITTGIIERTHMLWTLTLRQILKGRGMSFEEIENKVRELKKKPMDERNAIIHNMLIVEKSLPDLKIQNIFLNWNEVSQLSKSIFEIGSHAVSHEKLTELPDNLLLQELVDSKKILEEKIGLPVGVISYPYGRHDVRVIQYAKQTGYDLGVSTLVGFSSFGYLEKSPFRIKRVNPEEDATLLDFKVRLYLGF
jgi:peptidoglycan/xylan/chitin deacetylase (PgdA/CDA1 family)